MAYADEVLADSPLLYWKLDEASGATAADATGNGRTGDISATGITYSATGATTNGTALTFDGSTGCIKSTSTITPSSSVVTFECWALFPSFNNTDDLLAEYSPNYNSNSGSFLINPCSSAGGNWQLGIRQTSGTTNRTFTRPSTGQYHHFVFVFDCTAATTVMKAYVDSVAQTLSGSGNVTSANFGTYNLNVASRNAASLFLNATIDHVAFYNTELSSARVTAHYNAAAGATVNGSAITEFAFGTTATGRVPGQGSGTSTYTQRNRHSGSDIYGRGYYGRRGGGRR